MNIRLDKNVRIRIDHEDLARLRQYQHIEQDFQISGLRFKISIRIKSDISRSDISQQKNEIYILLGQRDIDGLLDDVGGREGIVIDGVCLQVDKWDKQKRERHSILGRGDR